MSELGQRLRAAREARGLSLVQAEEATRIRRDFLQALEEERFDALPGAVYAKGFIRNYCRYLGLDPQECLAEYQASSETQRTALPQVLSEPLLPDGGRRRDPVRQAILWLLLALLALAVAWLAYSQFILNETPWPISLLAAKPTPTATPTLAVPTSAVPQPSATAPAAPTAEELPTATLTPTDVTPVPPTVTPTPTRTRTLTPIPTATPSAPTPTPSPTLGEGFVVELRVDALCYVRVQVDGQMVLEANLNPGENQRWTPKERFDMRVGNAGGVVLAVNGVDQPPLGVSGQIVDVAFTLDTLP